MGVRLFLIYFYLVVQADFTTVNDLDLSALQRNLILDALVFNLIASEGNALLAFEVALAMTVSTARRGHFIGGAWLAVAVPNGWRSRQCHWKRLRLACRTVAQ